ncbi:hypothetical protein ZWY2020_057687 [Hordeum vulgare]|nr:hypothetical protein ZWY2020_057687 [Hordeum vulgare]
MAEAGASALMDLPEPLLLHIMGYLADPRSRHSASMACRRTLAAERATRAAMALRGDPRTPDFLLLPPAFCFPALRRLDLSLASPWGHPLLSSASRVAGAPASASSNHLPLTPEEAAERNAFVAARLAAYFPAVARLAVYCRDPSTLASLAPCWRATLRAVRLVRWHQRPLDLPAGADLEPLLASCPNLAELDLSDFYCWTEDVLPALAAHPAAACPALRRLVAPCVFNPRYVDHVGDAALLALASSCPLLTVLRLSEPFEPASTSQREQAGITAMGLVEFFAALPGLEDLMLDLQHNVLEAAPAMELLARRCPRIKVLTLGCFQGLCKAAWLYLDGVAVCGGLESLCIKNCEDLTDASLGAIGRGCGRLAKFAIQGCDLVTAVGIRTLAKALRPTLKEVSVLHCRFLHTAACLAALNPIRDRIEILRSTVTGRSSTTGCDHEDDEPDEMAYQSAPKKCRFSYMEMDNYESWEMLRSLSLWCPAGQLLSPLISAGLDSCPVLEKISIKVEGDLRTCHGHFTAHGSFTVGRFYLSGIESLLSLYELDYWHAPRQGCESRSLSLPAVALFNTPLDSGSSSSMAPHEHFMSFFQKMPNLRGVQLREDYYPARRAT